MRLRTRPPLLTYLLTFCPDSSKSTENSPLPNSQCKE